MQREWRADIQELENRKSLKQSWFFVRVIEGLGVQGKQTMGIRKQMALVPVLDYERVSSATRQVKGE